VWIPKLSKVEFVPNVLSKALRIGFISFNRSLDSRIVARINCENECRGENFHDILSRSLFQRRFLKSVRRKRSNFQQPLPRLPKLNEMNSILKALLNFCTTKNLFKRIKFRRFYSINWRILSFQYFVWILRTAFFRLWVKPVCRSWMRPLYRSVVPLFALCELELTFQSLFPKKHYSVCTEIIFININCCDFYELIIIVPVTTEKISYLIGGWLSQ